MCIRIFATSQKVYLFMHNTTNETCIKHEHACICAHTYTFTHSLHARTRTCIHVSVSMCWAVGRGVVQVCCSVLQCVAVCCRVLQCVAECCSVLQCVAVCCSVLQCVAVCCSMLQCVVLCCSVWCRTGCKQSNRYIHSMCTYIKKYMKACKHH